MMGRKRSRRSSSSRRRGRRRCRDTSRRMSHDISGVACVCLRVRCLPD
jgi:hypothetical protein